MQDEIPMDSTHAATKADDFIRLILQNQPGVLGTAAIHNQESAKLAAQAVATFRRLLIDQLKQQP